MKRTLILAMLTLFWPAGLQAQIITGTARAIDGDTLEMGDQRIRLHGMDAVELDQSCPKDGTAWPCGQEAKALLAQLVNGKAVTCEQVDFDAYRRTVARCESGGLDLGRTLVDAGLAIALPQFSDAYVETEGRVRGHAIGIWGGTFDTPAAYRAAHPRKEPRPAVVRAAPITRPATGVYFATCAQAWAAGAAPIYLGQPGYRPEMDGDRDGIACEPFRRR